LKRVRHAFEEYIATTEGLEVDVNKELGEMQKRLKQSSSANQNLAQKLGQMQLVLKDLERSSDETKERLKAESKLRREAERALAESGRNVDRIDSSQLRIVDSGILTEAASNTTKGFTERELETVTEELITAQRRLRKTEEQLEKSQALVKDLERNLQNIESDEASKDLLGDDKALLRELDEIRAEIDAARNEIQSHPADRHSSDQQQFDYAKQLQESQEEVLRLNEEITCLRNILFDQDMSSERTESHAEKSGKERYNLQKEIDRLKGQLRMANDENRKEMVKVESYWRNKFLEEKPEKLHSEDMSDDDIIGVRFANGSVSSYGERMMEEKLKKTEKMLKESREECSEMRSEMMVLTESLYEARHKKGGDQVRTEDRFRIEVRRQESALTDAWNEVEDKKKEVITLENTLMSTQEEVRLLSEEISNMSFTFEKAQEEYNSVVEELEKVQHLYESSLSKSNPKEISLLRTQFQILNEKNEALARHIRDIENEFSSAREKQENVETGVRARTVIAEELKNVVDRAVFESDQRNHEVDELQQMMESRMSLTEKSVDMLEKEVSVVLRSVSKAQQASLEQSEHIHDTNLEVENVEGLSHEWLADQFKHEKDEKVKAAISATMTYLSSTRMKDLEDDVDKILDDILSERSERTDTSGSEAKVIEGTDTTGSEAKITEGTDTTGSEAKVTEAPTEYDAYQSALNISPRLREISHAIEKLKIMSTIGESFPESRISDDEHTTGTTASISSSSLQSIKAKSKYAEIIQKVADYNKSYPQVSEDKHETEARGEIDLETRE